MWRSGRSSPNTIHRQMVGFSRVSRVRVCSVRVRIRVRFSFSGANLNQKTLGGELLPEHRVTLGFHRVTLRLFWSRIELFCHSQIPLLPRKVCKKIPSHSNHKRQKSAVVIRPLKYRFLFFVVP